MEINTETRQLLGGFTSAPLEQDNVVETPEDLDAQRLEEEIERTFESRKLFTNLLITTTFTACNISATHFLSRVGLPAIGGSLLGGVAVAITLGNALTKIRINDGRPRVGKEFALGVLQSACVLTSVCVGSAPYHKRNQTAKKEIELFNTEVQETYSPVMSRSNPLSMGVGVVGGVAALLLIGIVLGRKNNGF